MISDEELEKYRKPDESIDWGKFYSDLLANNQLSIINHQPTKKRVVLLQDLPVFKLADELSDDVWQIVEKWDWFAKKTVGDQIVRAADSIGANVSEGYGRYFFGEYLVFLYYARGSTYETWYWLEKARKRKLISQDEYQRIKEK